MQTTDSKSALPPLGQDPAWQALRTHRRELEETSLKQLFTADPDRAAGFSLKAAGLLLDYSKNLITLETRDKLVALAQSRQVDKAIRRMFAGEAINNTENRPALHIALRQNPARLPQAHTALETLNKVENFVARVISGQWKGFSGQAIKDVVNIGIGGSDLGPVMVHEALKPYHHGTVRCHFVSNVDPLHMEQTLAALNPETTLFIIASKSFTTLETSQNAHCARRWLLQAAGTEAALEKHFVAVTAKVDKAVAFGINARNLFPMWDWVGGRYSLWSAIGLPIALAVGMDNFRQLLAGAQAMDEHFRDSPLQENLPVILALLNLWYGNGFGAESQAVLPYHQNLHLLPAYLQQLDMESLGKSVSLDGSPLTEASGSIVWGSAGTNGQHSFHQLLHQGTHLVPADFIAVANSTSSNREQHRHLLANCFSQSQALMEGKTRQEAREELLAAGMNEQEAAALAPHKVIPGNRPSNTLMMPALTPYNLGSLLAAYEHKIYVLSVLWQINAFDQWGVELGKALSSRLFSCFDDAGQQNNLDASTRSLIQYCLDQQNGE